MEIKLFSNRPESFEQFIDHSNALFCEDEYKNPEFPFFYPCGEKYLLIVAIDNNKEVLGGIQLSYTDDGWLIEGVDTGEDFERPKWCMSCIGVHPKHQNKGVSKTLIAEQFNVMKKFGIDDICQSSYTEDGMMRVMPIYRKYISENPDIRYLDFEREF